MKRIILLAVMGTLTLSGWASAQKQQLQNHLTEARMEPMEDASCSNSSNSSGGQ
jgi:hypothetical protein